MTTTKASLQESIKKFKAGIKSPATPKAIKAMMEKQLAKAETALKDLEKAQSTGKSTAPAASKAAQAAAAARALAKKIRKQQGLPTSKDDIERDAQRSAITKVGKRIAKDSGAVYYEYRDNRLDRRPKKYPRLEHGGELHRTEETGEEYKKGGKLSGKANYLSNREIESVTTWDGKVIDGDQILDGIYVKKGVKIK